MLSCLLTGKRSYSSGDFGGTVGFPDSVDDWKLLA